MDETIDIGNHRLEYGMQVGPSITINPVHELKISLYFRLTPSYSMMYLDDSFNSNFALFYRLRRIGGLESDFGRRGRSLGPGQIQWILTRRCRPGGHLIDQNETENQLRPFLRRIPLLKAPTAITKKRAAEYQRRVLCVELPGFEPRITGPESVVLPLHHSSMSFR